MAVQALSEVDLTVPAGQFLVVAGSSGSGKSTLLHLLGGLDQPDCGAVVVAGTDLATLTEAGRTEVRRHQLGFVFQRKNPVRGALGVRKRRVWSVAERRLEGRAAPPGRGRTSSPSASPIACAIAPTTCLEANGSASRWRERWCTIPSRCSRMSRPRASTRGLVSKWSRCCLP